MNPLFKDDFRKMEDCIEKDTTMLKGLRSLEILLGGMLWSIMNILKREASIYTTITLALQERNI